MARNHFKTTDLLENRQNHGCNHLETWTTLGTRQHPVVHQSDHTCHKLAPVSVYLSVSSTKVIKAMAQQLVVFEGWMWMLSIYRFIKGYWGPQGSPTDDEVPVGRTKHHSTGNTNMAKVNNIDKQQRVVIPPPTKIPPNPHITGGLTSRLLTTPSETDSAITQRTRFEAREDKALRYKLLQFDQRSFMWCVPNLDNELSHRGNSFPI